MQEAPHSKGDPWMADGGPAFPSAGTGREHGETARYRGMTLRDWFAGQALAGWLASYGPDTKHPFHSETLGDTAREAYVMADAMLKVRADNAPVHGDD